MAFNIGQTVVIKGETYKITNVYKGKKDGEPWIYYELSWDFVLSQDKMEELCLVVSKK